MVQTPPETTAEAPATGNPSTSSVITSPSVPVPEILDDCSKTGAVVMATAFVDC